MTEVFKFLLAALALATAPAHAAETLLNDDFQDGEADGWLPRGEGDLRLTTYEGNVSMRLQNTAEAITAFSAAGYDSLQISGAFAADSLEPGEACLLEVSADKGASWAEIGQVEDGQDDAVTLHRLRAAAPQAAGADPVYVRVRIAGNSNDDMCWADNIRATGQPLESANTARFDAAFFTGDAPMSAPRALSDFAPDETALPASQSFQGVLTVEFEPGQTGYTIFNNDFGYADEDESFAAPPPLSIALVSDGSALIPARRGPIPADHPDWEWVIEPGVIWDEPGEPGWTRAVLPVSFEERNANCLHNGLLTFRFNQDGAVSRAAFEIAGETCAYFQLDLWGAAPAQYQPGAVDGADALKAAYASEVEARLPVRPIADISSVYPSADPADFGATSEVDSEAMTAYGFVIDGVNWTGGCDTRHGAYPFCGVLDIPSYSLAKSMFAGMALMRLETLYPGAKSALIADYVPPCGDDPDWRGVSFENALDMATGAYGKAGYEEDESGPAMRSFFAAEDHAAKINTACGAFSRHSEPGTIWAYHTSDTYILGTAMQAFLKARDGGDADTFRDLIQPLWSPLNLSPVTQHTRRTYDDTAQPFTGWGLTLHRDDLARLGRFIQTGAGGEVDAQMLRHALQHDPQDRGLAAGGDSYRYNNGFWAWNAGPALGCAADLWIPFMSGFGGLSVAFFPNDTLYYYVSDGYDFAWRRAAEAAHAIKPMCDS